MTLVSGTQGGWFFGDFSNSFGSHKPSLWNGRSQHGNTSHNNLLGSLLAHKSKSKNASKVFHADHFTGENILNANWVDEIHCSVPLTRMQGCSYCGYSSIENSLKNESKQSFMGSFPQVNCHVSSFRYESFA